MVPVSVERGVTADRDGWVGPHIFLTSLVYIISIVLVNGLKPGVSVVRIV